MHAFRILYLDQDSIQGAWYPRGTAAAKAKRAAVVRSIIYITDVYPLTRKDKVCFIISSPIAFVWW